MTEREPRRLSFAEILNLDTMDVSTIVPLRNPTVAWRFYKETLVIGNGYIMRNEASQKIWLLCSGRRNVRDIARVIAEYYDIDKEKAEKDTGKFIKQLLGTQLLFFS
ncbi:MAG: PqqD family protein [Theionarchaea archaeon]|nr:PqqD family protein [Theionarchaea archaeon]MBU7000084.1 PqqD family protein [Theionarchaea archaeon]MBU7022445.1 PqqD family protein [Theionarchaea archaeon]